MENKNTEPKALGGLLICDKNIYKVYNGINFNTIVIFKFMLYSPRVKKIIFRI